MSDGLVLHPDDAADTLDLDKLELRLIAGHPMVLLWRSEFNALVGEVRAARARLETFDPTQGGNPK
jgi:hypothetical protein